MARRSSCLAHMVQGILTDCMTGDDDDDEEEEEDWCFTATFVHMVG